MRALIADTYLESLTKLSVNDRNRVKVTTFDIQTNPDHPSLSQHTVDTGTEKHFWTARASRDLRIVLWKKDDVLAFCWAGHHDEAYRWAERNRFVENPESREFQIISTQTIVEEVTRTVQRIETKGERLFAQYGDAYLMALGVPEPWLPAVKDADEDMFLDKLAEHLPLEAQERLLALAAGEVVPVPPAKKHSADGNLAPFGSGDAKRHFTLIERHATKALERALSEPWARWTVFLHPDQQDLVDRSFDGPARVRGGAGTGKTIVALRRAVRLAQEGSGNILLTTYSKTLASRMLGMLDHLLDSEDPARDRITVNHLHDAANRLLSTESAERYTLITTADRRKALAEDAVLVAGGSATDTRLLLAEWERVIDPHDLRDEDDYLAARRIGRGEPLQPDSRRRVWAQYEALRAILERERAITFAGICNHVSAIFEQGSGSERPYRHVIADEIQDFGPAELKLLRSLAPVGDDDLFLTGDPGQRIYAGPSSLLESGIDIRGRAFVLRVNYRTSEQIKQFGDKLLPATFDEIDGPETRTRTVSTFSGPKPDIVFKSTVKEELEAATSWLKKRLQEGYRPEEIAIFARTKKLLRDRAERIVKACGLEHEDLETSDSPAAKRVTIGTLHRAKGLEFKVVLIIGAEDDSIPNAKALDVEVKNGTPETGLHKERSLVHVGATRARERLLITGAGKPSRFIRALIDEM